ncbi:uncharacterized protein YecT (DUF1311 family) [Deinobacterium chartae]|uniref:Uncharacterized protein YecT (DUF1311 family) n=1 Tax=Deinobacterium chartae TaxID=521158 RepID=A0A841I5B3_9DEIO|nr:lysozyme inhibitor LprI family protein [Deinobacterium chartae]MBB6099638.1 uncharacterized protein YecT (DUF1311 family) [Deinobacterium chartae]
MRPFLTWTGLLALTLSGFSARASLSDCKGGDQAAWTRCMERELRDSDRTINAVYSAQMAPLGAEQRTALRDAQRLWLRTRDRACGLDPRESNRERWFRSILRDGARTVCVVRFTHARIAELKRYVPTAPSFAETYDGDEYEYRGRREVVRGKYYLEVTVDSGKVARRAETELFVSVCSDRECSGRSVRARKDTASQARETVGVAFDLDNGRIYTHSNGQWDARPGSAEGRDLSLTGAFYAYVTSSTSLRDLVRSGLVSVHLEGPFRHPVPKGYRPLGR